ncbi:MAG: hypothetical protein KDA60_07740 [Planctomycetales bacterium]|nr:hypothetical protein [Planctomycetales bacterium]
MSMQTDLIGYLLGALDGVEHEEVRKRLEQDPQLRQQLVELEMRLGDLERERWRSDHEPPTGLADSTCQLVSAYLAGNTSEAEGEPERRPQLRPGWNNDSNPKRGGWNLVDMVVTAGICVAASFLFLPTVVNSRQQARIAGCQNNMRTVGAGMVEYDSLFGRYPRPPLSGNWAVAGFAAAKLREDGFVTEDKFFVCAGSKLATEQARTPSAFRVPDLDEVLLAQGRRLAALQQAMGGSYAYPVGFIDGRRYQAARHLGRARYAILADCPTSPFAPQMSANHSLRGLNVMFDDMHVDFVPTCRLADCSGYVDNIFLNDFGAVRPGAHANDSVLAASSVRPISRNLRSIILVPINGTSRASSISGP